jgi:hypothetical protein
MTDENVHLKVAMAEVLGLFLISLVAILVGMYGLEVVDGFAAIGTIGGIIPWIGAGLLLCTLVAFWNENILVTAAFGVFAIFCLSFNGMIGGVSGLGGSDNEQAMYYMIFVGIALAMIGLVSLAQPVKILPVFLFIAALAFIFLGLWYNGLAEGNADDYRTIVGALWTIAALLALYMATAISFLVVKGKPVLPLLITK